jgi:dTMP kinase
LLRGLSARLRARGIEPLETREPGGTPAGDRLRALLLDAPHALEPATELFIVNAARSEHVAKVLRPALATGCIVLCDRFADATIAYQGGGRGLPLAAVRTACELATGGLVPDLTLLVDLPWEAARKRLTARALASGEAADRLEREDAAFHERVRAAYLALAAEEPGRFVVLDGTLAPEPLAAAAWPHLSRTLGLNAS